MTENVNESIELPEELSAQDQADLASLWGEATDVKFRSILLIWDEVLKPENIAANRGISMQAATMLCGRYPQMTYEQIPTFETAYFTYLEELAAELHRVVEEKRADEHDPLGVENAEDDVARNGDAYVELLMAWQESLTVRELEWSPDQHHAAAIVAALGEVQNFFFGQQGLTGHLEVIKLEFTEEHTAELAARLQALRDEATGE